jgi:L-ascorbate metabolism protein UlaG (beta-lactamase superfamily)
MRARAFDHTLAVTNPGDPRVTFLGHATIVIDMDGVRLLTDPILRNRVGPLVRLRAPIEQAHWRGVDVVLISHSHWDHLDYGSLRMLGSDMPIVVPRGMAGALRHRGFRRLTEVEPGDDVEFEGVRVETVHAEHKGFGPPVGGTELSVGYVIHGSQRHYFAGDTAYFAGMTALDIGLDLALVPVWGWGPTAKPSEHLDPLGAARAVAAIKPRYAVPIHWGTLHPVGLRWMRPSTRIDPPHQFAQLVRRLAPDTIVRVMPVGSSMQVPHARGRRHQHHPGAEEGPGSGGSPA